MARKLTSVITVLVMAAGMAESADRFAVLEFFGRPAGTFCSAAGPAMLALQDEFEDTAVLLEYDYDRFPSGRLDRFWATGVSAPYLPLVMVGSGYETSSGSVVYEPVYRSMLEADLERDVSAEVAAQWRRRGDRVRAYIRLTNTSDTTLAVDDDASLWLVTYEESPIGVSSTWVRSTTEWFLPFDLGPGESTTTTIDSPPLSGVAWNRMAAVVLLEHRPGGVGMWDMIQGAPVEPAAISADRDNLRLGAGGGSADVTVDGPHILAWTADSATDWLSIVPASGDSLPATIRITLNPGLRPPTETRGTVTVTASGEGMNLEVEIAVEVGAEVRRPSRRIRPVS
jgi:hypothetical protein